MKDDFFEIKKVTAGYGKKKVLFDVSLGVSKGEIVSLIGHNGAGKTTLLRCAFGHIAPDQGEVLLEGKSMNAWPSHERVEKKFIYIPQEAFVFRELSVLENLHLAAYTLEDKRKLSERLEQCYEYLPVLKERAVQRAGTLSGGQQRMLSLGMIMVMRPKVLLLDEPSLGLAPALVDDAMRILRMMAEKLGMTVLLVEQNVKKAFAVSDRVYVLRAGEIIAERQGGELSSQDDLWDLF